MPTNLECSLEKHARSESKYSVWICSLVAGAVIHVCLALNLIVSWQ